MSLVTVQEVRDLVQTALDDARLQVIITREEQAVIDLFGAHYTDISTTITETVEGEDGANLYMRRPILSIGSVKEKTSLDDTTWDTLTENTDFYVWGGEGRIQRLSGSWGPVVEVKYVPQDDREKRRDAIIELVRIALERTAMRSENVASEYSYQAPEWEAERARILRGLGFLEV